MRSHYRDGDNSQRGIIMADEGQMAVSNDMPVASTGSEAPNVSTETPVTSEKMLPQSKVDSIIRERLREKESRLRSEYEQKLAQQQQQPMQSMGGMEQANPEHIRQMIAEETKKQQDKLAKEYLDYMQAQQAQDLVSRFTQKIANAKDKYPDFEDKVGALQLGKIPAIVQLADGVENTADVIYDLADNPHKIANILQFAGNPETVHLAQIAMQRLSNSIKANEEARLTPQARQPLSQIKPSNAGTDNGVRNIRDLRKQDWLRA